MKTSAAALLCAILFGSPSIVAEAETTQAATNATDLAQFATADALWAHIQKLQEPPKMQPSSQEEAITLFKGLLGNLSSAADEFVKRYPDDKRRWDAKLLQLQVAATQRSMEGQSPDPKATEAALKEIVEAKDASAQAKADARVALLSTRAGGLDGSSSPQETAAVDAEILAFQKDYPSDARNDDLKMLRAKLNEKHNPEASEALLKELAKSTNAPLARAAQVQLNAKDIGKKPIDLKFNALDGSQVDLAKLRGKVVLIDFWATWCGPCRQEMPNVIATYKKLHDKGFEIVGISLDRDKEKLLSVIKKDGMTWPQYFDGKGWQNEISTRFGIDSIPAQWLVDKKGLVRHTNARADLAKQVEQLLAE